VGCRVQGTGYRMQRDLGATGRCLRRESSIDNGQGGDEEGELHGHVCQHGCGRELREAYYRGHALRREGERVCVCVREREK